MPSERGRGASASAAASSCLPPQLLRAAARPADEDEQQLQVDDAVELAAAAAAAGAGDAGWHVCRTNEPDMTTGSSTGASRSGQRSPDDVIGSPGHPTRVVLTAHLYKDKYILVNFCKQP